MKSKGRKSYEQKKFRELRECSALTVIETRTDDRVSVSLTEFSTICLH